MEPNHSSRENLQFAEKESFPMIRRSPDQLNSFLFSAGKVIAADPQGGFGIAPINHLPEPSLGQELGDPRTSAHLVPGLKYPSS